MKNLKEINRRIDAVKGTQKVTCAMKMIAAAKMRHTQEVAVDGRKYSSEIYDSVTRVSKRLGNRAPALWRRPTSLDLVDLIVITSNRGLCGGFNENLLREAEEGIADHLSYNIDVKVYTVGRKGYKYLSQRGYDVELLQMDDDEGSIDLIVDMICDRYLSGESSGCNLGFNRFISATKQRITFWNLVPLFHIGGSKERFQEYDYEPNREGALDRLGRLSIASALRQAHLESAAAEMAARMTAMDGATKNADDMIEHLTSVYNKARQESITRDLMDIINGAEALR